MISHNSQENITSVLAMPSGMRAWLEHLVSRVPERSLGYANPNTNDHPVLRFIEDQLDCSDYTLTMQGNVIAVTGLGSSFLVPVPTWVATFIETLQQKKKGETLTAREVLDAFPLG